MTTSDVEVRAVDSATFAELVVSAAQIYGEAMRRPPELVVQRREIMQSHVHRAGFAAVVACAAHEPVGFGYGYRGRAGEWWHDIVAKALTRELGRPAAAQWLSGAFELAELHLLPSHHGHGVGRSMLELLLAGTTDDTVVLSTHDRESPARALYRSAGFVDLLTGFVFPGSVEVYALMGLRRR